MIITTCVRKAVHSSFNPFFFLLVTMPKGIYTVFYFSHLTEALSQFIINPNLFILVRI